MAYSFIATTNKVPDWTTLNAQVFKADSAIEMFPIISNESDNYSLGLSIPLFKLKENTNTWADLTDIINKLTADYNFKVFDLYNGFFVTVDNIDQVKKTLLED